MKTGVSSNSQSDTWESSLVIAAMHKISKVKCKYTERKIVLNFNKYLFQ